MSNFFNMDNGFFSALGKICDMLFLSVIWTLLCIPIITIGPANTALYYATVKVIRKERGYLFREFFKSFRMNFKRAAIVGVLLTLIMIILGFDLMWAWGSNSANYSKGSIMFGIFVAISFLVLSFSIYVYPVLSRFDMTIKQLIKAAAFMSMKHLPSTVAMVIVMAAAFASVIFVPISIFLVPAIATFVNSLLMERVLKKYMPKSEGTPEETGRDEWYLE
jgi:uncharacterized membrane protein YesL